MKQSNTIESPWLTLLRWLLAAMVAMSLFSCDNEPIRKKPKPTDSLGLDITIHIDTAWDGYIII